MTENVSGIGYTSTTGVGATTNNSQGSNKPAVEDEKTEVPQQQAPETRQIGADEILGFLAAMGQYNVQQFQFGYDINKYVSPESAARIASFVNDFEAGVAQGLIDIDNELGDLLSPEAKLALAGALAGE